MPLRIPGSALHQLENRYRDLRSLILPFQDSALPGGSASLAGTVSGAASGAGNFAGSMASSPSALAASSREAEAETKVIAVPGNMSRAVSAEPSCRASGQRSAVRSRSCRAASKHAGIQRLLHHARGLDAQKLERGGRRLPARSVPPARGAGWPHRPRAAWRPRSACGCPPRSPSAG